MIIKLIYISGRMPERRDDQCIWPTLLTSTLERKKLFFKELGREIGAPIHAQLALDQMAFML
jgi:hypothetical protein